MATSEEHRWSPRLQVCRRGTRGRERVRAGREAEQGKPGSRASFQLELYKHHHTLAPCRAPQAPCLGQKVGGDAFRSSKGSQGISGSWVQAEKMPDVFRESTMFYIVRPRCREETEERICKE